MTTTGEPCFAGLVFEMKKDQLFNSNPPAKDSDFEAIESILRLELPAHFESFLRRVNGGNVQKSQAYFPIDLRGGPHVVNQFVGIAYAEVIRFFGTADLVRNLKSSPEYNVYFGADQIEEEFEPPRFLDEWYPLLRIASGGTDDLYIPVRPSEPAVLFLHPNYLSEGYVAKGTIEELLNKMGRVDLDGLWEKEEPCETNLEPWTFIRTGNYEGIFNAIENGFDVDAVAEDNEAGTNLLMMALRGRRIELVQRLIEANANVNAQDFSGRPAIDYANRFNFAKRFLEGIKLMEDAGAVASD